jgi:hypothetical protein
VLIYLPFNRFWAYLQAALSSMQGHSGMKAPIMRIGLTLLLHSKTS